MKTFTVSICDDQYNVIATYEGIKANDEEEAEEFGFDMFKRDYYAEVKEEE